MAARVKMLESKVATVEAQLQKRIDSDSDAKASQSFLAAKVQALEAKVADLEARPPRNPEIRGYLGGQRGGGGQG